MTRQSSLFDFEQETRGSDLDGTVSTPKRENYTRKVEAKEHEIEEVGLDATRQHEKRRNERVVEVDLPEGHATGPRWSFGQVSVRQSCVPGRGQVDHRTWSADRSDSTIETQVPSCHSHDEGCRLRTTKRITLKSWCRLGQVQLSYHRKVAISTAEDTR